MLFLLTSQLYTQFQLLFPSCYQIFKHLIFLLTPICESFFPDALKLYSQSFHFLIQRKSPTTIIADEHRMNEKIKPSFQINYHSFIFVISDLTFSSATCCSYNRDRETGEILFQARPFILISTRLKFITMGNRKSFPETDTREK